MAAMGPNSDDHEFGDKDLGGIEDFDLQMDDLEDEIIDLVDLVEGDTTAGSDETVLSQDTQVDGQEDGEFITSDTMVECLFHYHVGGNHRGSSYRPTDGGT